MRKLIIIILTLAMAIGTACAQTLAQQADSAYNEGNYVGAVRLYHQAMNADGTSAELYYNLGNAYYRIGKLGRAVLYYNRALKLDPSMKEAKQNLEFAKTKILDKPEDDSSFLDNVHNGIVSLMNPNAWAWVAFGLFVLVLGCIAIYLFTTNVGMRKLGFFGGFIALFLFVYVLVVSAQASSGLDGNNAAVVIVPTSNLSTSPGAPQGSQIIPVHEGTVLQIVDSLAVPGEQTAPLWYDVKINNSTHAWVRAVDVERI